MIYIILYALQDILTSKNDNLNLNLIGFIVK
jgi:hypothetical protein